MDPELHEFYFGQDGIVLIPMEHLSREGIRGDFERALLEKTVLDREWIGLFNRAFGLYWDRALDLHARAPEAWLPPRVQHVCVNTAKEATKPYTHFLNRSSWSVEASDFRPESSSLEYAAYQFFHAERSGVMGQILPALVANLGYFRTLSADQLRDFREGCRLSRRDDAAGFHALADATVWISQSCHQPLKESGLHLPGYVSIPYCGLIMPAALQGRLAALQESWGRAVRGAFDGYLRFHGKSSPARGGRICEWLRATKPVLLVVGDQGRIVWDPESPESTGDLLAQLGQVTEQAEDRIIRDLEVIGHHSSRFLKSLREPAGLADPAPFMTQGGLSYIHAGRKLVAYSIHDERGQLRLAEPGPPYERLMLGARTMHEWGHLSAESNWIGVPDEAKPRRDELRAELAALIESIHAAAPAHVRAVTASEIGQLEAASKTGSAGRRLVNMMMVRSEDFQANLLAKHYLRTAEMETYIRNNVFSFADTNGLYAGMLRHAYQYQYLRLSRIEDPMGFFLKGSWFRELFCRPGIVTEEQFHQVVALVGQICDCYTIDESKFDFASLAG